MHILFFQILDLYLRKNLIKIVSAETLVYQFLIVPKHVKQDLLVTAPAACWTDTMQCNVLSFIFQISSL